MLARDHYAALGVPAHASAEEIEEAYRHLSRRYHPDVNPGDPRAAAVYDRLQAAYEVLSDPEERARYDRGASAEGGVADPVGLDVRLRSESGPQRSWRDLLAELKEHARQLRPRRGDDITTTVEIPLLQVERGRRTPLRIRHRTRCESCRGSGRVRIQEARTCAHCDGSGAETFVKGHLAVSAPCRECRGDGAQRGSACDPCGGSGVVTRDRQVVVRIPGGVQDGHRLRLLGEGHAGPLGGPPGDLVVEVRVAQAPGYERSGPHLIRTVELDYTTAILGGRLALETLDGEPVSLKIPPLTPNGHRFRLRERGLEMSDGRRGDMLVRVQIRMPDSIDEDGKRLVRQLAERSSAPRTAHPARAPEGDR